MRPLIATAIVCLTLFPLHPAGAAPDRDHVCGPNGQHTIKDIAEFVKKDGTNQWSDGTNISLPARFSESLKLGKDDLLVTRLANLDKENDIFRSFDMPRDKPDYVLFKRGPEVAMFWRVTPSGKTVLTVQSGKHGPIVVVPNAQFAGELTALCDFFFEFMRSRLATTKG